MSSMHMEDDTTSVGSPSSVNKGLMNSPKGKKSIVKATNTSMRTSKRLPRASSGINGGRWTQKEHDDFLIGLELYGREWKKVAVHINTRTSAQIRSHAQKYFAKLSKEEGEDHPHRRFMDSSTRNSPTSSTENMSSPIQPASASELRLVETIFRSSIESLSPKTRTRVSRLGADEVCAVQVLATYAIREIRRTWLPSDTSAAEHKAYEAYAEKKNELRRLEESNLTSNSENIEKEPKKENTSPLFQLQTPISVAIGELP